MAPSCASSRPESKLAVLDDLRCGGRLVFACWLPAVKRCQVQHGPDWTLLTGVPDGPAPEHAAGLRPWEHAGTPPGLRSSPAALLLPHQSRPQNRFVQVPKEWL